MTMQMETRRPAPRTVAAPPAVLMNAFLRNPWTFIRNLQDETVLENEGTKAAWIPAMEIFRRGSELVVHAELPGLRTDDIDVRVQDNALVIAGERKQQRENTAEGVYRSERRYGSFQRTVPLPEGVSEEQISASFSDGVLEVRVPLPVQPEKTARKIKIS